MPQNQKDPRQILTNDDGQPAVDMARGLRRLFEADPAGAVQRQVDFKLTELSHRGLWQDPAQEGVLRRLLTRHYQTDAGIAEPRHLSNQERAELALAFRDADTAGRIDLLETLESEHGPDFPAVTKELFEALPQAERPGARRIAAHFLENREASIEPLVGARIAGLPEDLKALSEQVVVEEARADQPLDGREASEDRSGAVADEPPVGSAELQPRAEAAAFLTNGLAVTSNWAGPAFTSKDTAFLAELIDGLITAERDDLPHLIEQVEDVFGDDPETAQRLATLARMRFAEPEGLQGQLSVGSRREAERELRLFRNRLLAGEDYHPQHQADRAAFARAEEVSGFRLQLQEDGSIAIGEPGETPLVTVGWSVASAMARNPEALRKRFTLLERLLTSNEPLDEQVEEINRAFGFSDQADIETPTSFDQDTRNAILVANAALREGRDPAAVRAGLIGLLFPEIHRDPIAWGELVLDILPIVGEVRALAGMLESYDAFVDALKRGDATEANRQGISLLLDAAGLAPVAVPIFKALRTIAKRTMRTRLMSTAVRTVPGVRFLHASRTLAKARQGLPDFVEKLKMADAFRTVIPKLNRKQKSLLRGLWPHFLGRPGEKDLDRMLRNLGMGLETRPEDKKLIMGGRKRILDAVTKRGFSKGFLRLTRSFVLPSLGEPGTLFEAKLALARSTKTQKIVDPQILQHQAAGQPVFTISGIGALEFELMKFGFDTYPEDLVRQLPEELLRRHTTGPSARMTDPLVDELVEAFVSFHREIRTRTAGPLPTLGEAIMALGMAASVRAAENAAVLDSERSQSDSDPSRF